MERKETKALAKPYDIITNVAITLRKFTEDKELLLPDDYSIENALKSAWLILQETVDKDKKPVLEVCSRASIANALLDMAVQGLNPGKKQCYFIAYGSKLICQRSYFGTMAVAERVAGAKDIWAEVVYQGDGFEYEIAHNRKNVTKHIQKLENIKSKNIVATYCVIEFQGKKPAITEIMTMEQVRQAWAKSKMNPDTSTSIHAMFTEEMCKRTVINRACKKIINSSSDNNLFLKSFHRVDDEQIEADIAAEIDEKANKEIIDVNPDTGEITEGEVARTQEPEAKPIKVPPKAELAKKKTPKKERDISKILTIADMRWACWSDFNMQPKQVCAELGVASENEITQSPQDCYRQIAAVRMPVEQEVECEF